MRAKEREQERGRESACVHVCVGEREREIERVRERELKNVTAERWMGSLRLKCILQKMESMRKKIKIKIYKNRTLNMFQKVR